MATKKLTYAEQLKDPRWQNKRLEILSRDEFTCQACSDTESTLHVHHKHYIKGRMPWEYEEHELVTLCESCHDGIDAQTDAVKHLFAKLRLDGPWSQPEAVALIAGWATQVCGYDLSSFFDASPFCYVQGQVANYLDELTMGDLFALQDGLRKLAPEKRRHLLKELVTNVVNATQAQDSEGETK